VKSFLNPNSGDNSGGGRIAACDVDISSAPLGQSGKTIDDLVINSLQHSIHKERTYMNAQSAVHMLISIGAFIPWEFKASPSSVRTLDRRDDRRSAKTEYIIIECRHNRKEKVARASFDATLQYIDPPRRECQERMI
jgi:hypothetical protein